MLCLSINTSHVITTQNDNPTFHISSVIHAKKPIATKALIDSGAEGIFMDTTFTKTHHISTFPLKQPIMVLNVDGSPNSSGNIYRYTWKKITFGSKTIFTRFLITKLGKEEIILGLPWLHKHNPQINWKQGTLRINKLTTAMELAQQNHKTNDLTIPEIIPKEYHQYLSVFEKKASECFPISRPYDHAIDLKPDFIPRDCKIYPLAPKEQQALNDFIDENLRKGYIRPSKSPMASPFFFVGKKDESLRACQDYRALN